VTRGRDPIQPTLGGVLRCCPATRAAAMIGDGWVQAILREALAGTTRYSDFLARLGISRTVLADRLRRMVQDGILDSPEPARAGGHRHYLLSEKGRDAIGIVLVADAWERMFGESDEDARGFVDATSGLPVDLAVLMRPHGRPIEARRLNYVVDRRCDDPAPAATARRKASPDAASARTSFGASEVLGDSWSWMILIAAYFRARRFDEFAQALGIASNILTDRLNRLVAADLLIRERYMRAPDRYEYRLAVAGRALHGLFCALYGWGEKWLYPDDAPPMRLFDMITGERVMPVVCDATTGAPIALRDIRPGPVAIAA
jgi:DNA-binding HxlR family transcriptional regulator